MAKRQFYNHEYSFNKGHAHELSILGPPNALDGEDIVRGGARSLLNEMNEKAKMKSELNAQQQTAWALKKLQQKGVQFRERKDLIDKKYQNLQGYDIQNNVAIPNGVRNFKLIQKGEDDRYAKPFVHKSKLKLIQNLQDQLKQRGAPFKNFTSIQPPTNTFDNQRGSMNL